MGNRRAYSEALQHVAVLCVRARQKKKCKAYFDSPQCTNCQLYIKSYIQADNNSIQLFMLQARSECNRKYADINSHRPVLALAMMICILLGSIDIYKINSIKKAQIERELVTQVQTATSTLVSNKTTEKSAVDIWKILELVSNDMNNGIDVNNNGKTNCEDAAIQFYYYYPDKKDVKIIVNSKINHAFNAIRTDEGWVYIEPQAVYTKYTKTYLMRDIWKDYSPNSNKDATAEYKMYARRK